LEHGEAPPYSKLTPVYQQRSFNVYCVISVKSLHRTVISLGKWSSSWILHRKLWKHYNFNVWV